MTKPTWTPLRETVLRTSVRLDQASLDALHAIADTLARVGALRITDSAIVRRALQLLAERLRVPTTDPREEHRAATRASSGRPTGSARVTL